MLNQHFLHRFGFDIRIERALANRIKRFKGAFKAGVIALVVNFLHQRARQFGHALDKRSHGGIEALAVGLGVAEEAVEEGADFFAARQVELADLFVVLPQKGALRVLENRVVNRIIERDFLLDFNFERVFFVFGFPVTERRIIIANRAIDFLAPVFANGILFDKQKSALLANLLQQPPKRAPRLRLGDVPLRFQLRQSGLIKRNRRMGLQ